MVEVEFLLPSGDGGRKSHASSCSETLRSSGGRRQNHGGKERPAVHFCGLTRFIHQPSLKKNFYNFISLIIHSHSLTTVSPLRFNILGLGSRISASLSHDIHIDVPSLFVLEQSCTAKIPNGVALHAIIQSYCEARCRWSQERYKFKHLGRRA
jgi:hypothetical protein